MKCTVVGVIKSTRKTPFKSVVSVCILNSVKVNVKGKHDTTHSSTVLDDATFYIELTLCRR
jgi:hypothetical protein